MESEWKSRIVGSGTEPPDALLANPRNGRIHPKHQQEALGAALDQIGWVQNIIVNRVTGHVIDGHLRVALALSREEASVPVSYVELSEEEEQVALATLDPLAGLAVTDEGALKGLLADLEGKPRDELTTMLAAQANVTYDDGIFGPPDGVEIDARKDELDNRMKEWTHERIVDVDCPSCGASFGVKLSDLMEAPSEPPEDE